MITCTNLYFAKNSIVLTGNCNKRIDNLHTVCLTKDDNQTVVRVLTKHDGYLKFDAISVDGKVYWQKKGVIPTYSIKEKTKV